MPYPSPFGPITASERRAVEQAAEAARFAEQNAADHDREATFPLEGLAALAKSGYLALAVPAHLGGEGAGVADLVLGSLELARGDASLALVVAMHGALVGRTRDAGLWPPDLFESVAREIGTTRSERGALINSLASEPEMGSPSRGGLPRTHVEPTAKGWRLQGRKTFSSGAPVLRWALVQAAAGDEAANFLVPMELPHVRIEPSWDSLGMRATGSDTVVFEDVDLPIDARLPRPSAGEVPYERAWGLVIAAVYLGVAEAARDAALQFARERKPTALGGKSIASAPPIRRRAGEIDLMLYQARGLLVSTARAWDAASAEQRPAIDGALVAAKVHASNTAITVTDQAMRLVGGTALVRGQALERHYRDVRGGLQHPPQDDLAIEVLAHAALDATS